MNYLEIYKEKQPIVFSILNNSLLNNNISHAYLIDSNDNSLLNNFSLALSKSIICKEHIINQCEKCNICKLIDKMEYPDLLVINPINLVIKKEQIIDLKEKFMTVSLYDNVKVYIINGCEYLNEFSANTLLKFLEEPEKNIYAILLTNNINKVKQTIISRCQVIHLNNTKELIYDNIKMDKVLEFQKMYETKKIDTILFINKYFNDIFKDKESTIESLDMIVSLYKKNIEELIIKSDNEKELKKLVKKIEIIIDCKKKIISNCNLKLVIDNMIISMEEI